MESLAILSLLMLYNGCSTHQTDAKIDFQPPKYVEQTPPLEPRSALYNPGSLFGRGDSPVFSDKKAMNVNDIVTVVINENILSSSSGTKKLSKTTGDKLGGGVVTAGGGGLLANVANQANKLTNIGMQIDSSTSFNGTGTHQRTEKFTTTVSARIIKILDNGNYFIDGRREMLLDGQKQILHISGVIRPNDITQTNQIDSKYIADAKILYETQGDIKESTERNWGTKAVESIWPF
ncbi:flagellar basal body L-ring protein FlgH [Hydrogenimonas cancrithermarum]|uniref:flagellar basal body L-ring protein FlgH n=1 Tax=Hydrogenimonas cancrithermarum TaxID=2993563 RepID=UPI003872D240